MYLYVAILPLIRSERCPSLENIWCNENATVYMEHNNAELDLNQKKIDQQGEITMVVYIVCGLSCMRGIENTCVLNSMYAYMIILKSRVAICVYAKSSFYKCYNHRKSNKSP